jgi:hypothetical protein
MVEKVIIEEDIKEIIEHANIDNEEDKEAI